MLGRVKDSTAFRSVVRDYARSMVSGALEPYDAGLEIWGRAVREWPSDDGDEVCIALQLLWGALTDWVELRPSETAEAEGEMVRAAREWLVAEGTADAEAQYFDRWIAHAEACSRPHLSRSSQALPAGDPLDANYGHDGR